MRLWIGLGKAVLGFALLAALLFFEQIDLNALVALVDAPAAVAIALGLVLVSIPLAALRWHILLRAFGLSIPFGKVLHFFCIGLFANVFLLGPTGGDAVRGVYAWRAIGGGSGRVAVSILADRLIGLFGLLCIPFLFSLFNWQRLQQAPALATLATSLVLAFAASIVGVSALFAAPRLIQRIETALSRWPRAAERVRHVRILILMLRTHASWLIIAFLLAVMIQICAVSCVLVLAEAIKIGTLQTIDFVFVTPLTLIVNALPLTPNGLGVGEVAFNQICHWLEPVPSNAAYSSIFFAFRAISLVAALPGLISFVIYRKGARSTD